MTLADLCTALLERESVIHSFGSEPPKDHMPRTFGRTVPTNEIAAAAEELGTFTRGQLQDKCGCTYRAARGWIDRAKGRLIEFSHEVEINGGVANVWRWR